MAYLQVRSLTRVFQSSGISHYHDLLSSRLSHLFHKLTEGVPGAEVSGEWVNRVLPSSGSHG